MCSSLAVQGKLADGGQRDVGLQPGDELAQVPARNYYLLAVPLDPLAVEDYPRRLCSSLPSSASLMMEGGGV